MRYKRGTDVPGDPEGERVRDLRDRGAAAVEFAGLTVLASLIVAAIMATPIAKTMAAYTGTTVDKILDTGDDVQTGSGGINLDAAGAPSKMAAVAVDWAVRQAGKRYGWGAEGPDAFDCSGLMQWAYNRAGLSILRTSSAQWGSEPHVPGGINAKLLPGDLVFFNIPSDQPPPPNHVAMYMGNGQIIEAYSYKVPLSQQIRVSTLQSYKDRGVYMGATRPTGGSNPNTKVL